MWQTGGVPAEVEEASREAKRIVLVSAAVGAVLLLLAAYIGIEVYLNPSDPFLPSGSSIGLPFIALLLFLVMGVLALYVALVGVADARRAWEAGNFPKAYKTMQGLLVFGCLGGIAPGFFVFRTVRSLHPLAESRGPAPTFVGTACSHCGAPLDPRDKFCRACGGSSPQVRA